MQCPLQALMREERNIGWLRENMCCDGEPQLWCAWQQHVGVWGKYNFPAVGKVVGKASGAEKFGLDLISLF